MKLSDEQLSALIDGALSDSEADSVKAALENDLDAQARMSGLRGADAIMMRAAQTLDERPMPKSVLDLLGADDQNLRELEQRPEPDLRDDNKIVPFQTATRSRSYTAPFMAIAASLMLAVGFTGGWLSSLPRTGESGGVLTASLGVIDQQNPLYASLTGAVSGEVLDISGSRPVSVMPVLSFIDQDGNLCREVVAQSEGIRNHLLACRQQKAQWTIVTASAVTGAAISGGTFTVASSGTPAAIDAAIDARIKGQVLSREEESKYLGLRYPDN